MKVNWNRWRRWRNKGKLLWLIIPLLIIGALGFFFYSGFWLTGAKFLATAGSASFSPVNLTHEQEVWLHALEWCESSGIRTAINEADLDGTPSYYSFQFKPETFRHFGTKYGLLSRQLSDEGLAVKLADYNLQKKVVSLMIGDSTVRWQREFPACIRRLGRPPTGDK